MSVKFERETFKQAEGVAGPAVSAAAELLGKDGPLPGTTGKHPISEAVGTALTGGKQMAGTKGYLMVCHVHERQRFASPLSGHCCATGHGDHLR